MSWITLINEIFDIGWLAALLVFLILIWRSSERREDHMHTIVATQVDVTRQNAESARIVAEAVRTLAAIVQNQQAK